VEYHEVNLGQLIDFKDGSHVTPESLIEARLVKNSANPVVLLGEGEVSVALNVSVHRISNSARAKIEAAGGSVEILSKQDGQ
jgi:large subunit ribosomal protein L15